MRAHNATFAADMPTSIYNSAFQSSAPVIRFGSNYHAYHMHAQDVESAPVVYVFLVSSYVNCRVSLECCAVCSGRQQPRTSCKSGTEDVAETNRRALLLALVAAPGLAQLQPAHAGGDLELPSPAERFLNINSNMYFMHAEAPSLNTYKDKSDEFSLSVPASESSTTPTCTYIRKKSVKAFDKTFIMQVWDFFRLMCQWCISFLRAEMFTSSLCNI